MTNGLPHKVNLMLIEVLKYGEFRFEDFLSLVYLTIAGFITMYLVYGTIVAWLLHWTTISVKLSLHVRHNTHPLCAKCAGGAVRTIWRTYDFSFHTPIGEPTRIRLFNNFRSDSMDLLEDSSFVKRVEIHHCGTIEDIVFEMSAEPGSARLLCMPSQDYVNIMLEEKGNCFINPKKLGHKIWTFPRTVYVAWGRVLLDENFCSIPFSFYEPWIAEKLNQVIITR